MSYPGITVKDLKWLAASYGHATIGNIKVLGDSGYEFAKRAAHFALEYIERKRVAEAPLNAIIQNRAAFAQRLAQTPRCHYRRVEVFTDPKTGEVQHSIGDPCGGKLVVKKLRREIVDVVCRACGRSGIPTEVAQQQEAA